MRIEQKTWTGRYKTLAYIPVDKLDKNSLIQMGLNTHASIRYPEYSLEYSFCDVNITIFDGDKEIRVTLSPREILTMAEQLTANRSNIQK